MARLRPSASTLRVSADPPKLREGGSGFGEASRFWGPVVLYMGLIFWSSSRERPDVLSATPDYLLHGTEYAGLVVVSVRALAKRLFSGLSTAHIAGGIAIAVLYGMSDEWHQLYVPGRDGSLVDVLADFGGAALGGAFLAAVSALNRTEGETR
jgi:VanZ family protein